VSDKQGVNEPPLWQTRCPIYTVMEHHPLSQKPVVQMCEVVFWWTEDARCHGIQGTLHNDRVVSRWHSHRL